MIQKNLFEKTFPKVVSNEYINIYIYIYIYNLLIFLMFVFLQHITISVYYSV